MNYIEISKQFRKCSMQKCYRNKDVNDDIDRCYCTIEGFQIG